MFKLNFNSNYDKCNYNNVNGLEARRPGRDRAAAAVEIWLSVSESERAEIHQEVLTTQIPKFCEELVRQRVT